MPRYQYTKSQIILGLTEDLLLQEDYALVEKVQRSTGIDLLNEDDFSDEALWDIAQMSEEEIQKVLEDSWAGNLVKHVSPFHTSTISTTDRIGQAVGGAVGSVGTTIGSGLHGLGLHNVGALATSHPIAAGAAAIGLGAAAALRMRSNMKARAQAQASGMH